MTLRPLILAVVLALVLVMPVSAGKEAGSCSVTPNPVSANATITITATANVGFDFYLTDPTGRTWQWPQSPAGTVTYNYSSPLAGDWTVTIRNIKGNHPQRIGGCSFVVTP